MTIEDVYIVILCDLVTVIKGLIITFLMLEDCILKYHNSPVCCYNITMSQLKKITKNYYKPMGLTIMFLKI